MKSAPTRHSPRPPKPSENELASSCKFRVYPVGKQAGKAGTWLFIAHRFRNEAVAFLAARRKNRWEWIKKNPALAKDGVPEEFAGSDTTACSKWLTHRLEQARERVRLEAGVACSKLGMAAVLSQWSRAERESVEDAWLLALPRTILDQAIRDLEKTIARAIDDRKKAKKQPKQKGQKKKLAGWPTFHQWQHAGSVRLQVEASKNASFRDHWAAGEIFVPGLGRLRFRDASALPATPPKLITLSRNAANQWHVSFACVGEESRAVQAQRLAFLKPLPLDEAGLPKAMGFDLSLTNLLVDSDGKASKRSRHLKKSQRRHRRLSKKVSRCKKGSGRWKKAVRELGKAEARLANRRAVAVQALAQDVVAKASILCLEDFSLAFMLQNKCLAASTHDAGLGKLRQAIDWEAAKHGRLVLQCDRFDASSKTCSKCDWVKHDLKLNDRTWTCSSCNTLHDRDQNAAVNIRAMALRKAIADLSSVPENGVGVLADHRLHPDLQAFVARGGLTALWHRFDAMKVNRGGVSSPVSAGADQACVLPKPKRSSGKERTRA